MKQYVITPHQPSERKIQAHPILVTHDIEEAIYLADRSIVLKNHPMIVSAVLANPLPKPRTPERKTKQEFRKL
ncbi:MAG: hypothetical protein J4215_04300 [Candidatus Diapherotrites archaeon]|uniref:ABC transporter ATP-binding protein n=1 Tax=Candidatus Iainarchaeum sp. TaxID=3101447 RepID=A0A8T4L5H5_9ARCH|nr:hypothetical protein [Candidatus Diapherotrites archaeon]